LSKPKKANDPNAYLAPYLKDAAGGAQTLYKSGGPGLAQWSDATTQGLQDQILRSRGGSPLVDAAQRYTQGGLESPIATQFGGGNPYADTENPFGQGQNPYLDAAFGHAAQQSQSALASEYAMGGRNIDASAPARADMLSSLAARIYAPAYESERNRQSDFTMQQQGIGAQGYESGQNRALADLTSQRGLQQNLLGYASPLAAQDYMDIAMQRDAGSTYDDRAQSQLEQPQRNLDTYISRLSGLAGRAGQPMSPVQPPNYLTAGLGGAMLGAQLFPPRERASTYTPYMGAGGGIGADDALRRSIGGLF
jgi:hypothetical protein